jgi:hypothetical protein
MGYAWLSILFGVVSSSLWAAACIKVFCEWQQKDVKKHYPGKAFSDEHASKIISLVLYLVYSYSGY